MKDNKRKIISCIMIIVIIILVIGIYVVLTKKNTNIFDFSKKEKVEIFCKDINDLQKNKSDFIVYVGKSGEEAKDNKIIKKIKTEYKKLHIIQINNNKQNTSCMQKILKNANLDNNATNQDFDYIILYKNGEYTGLYSGIDMYYSVIKHISDKGLIEKVNIKEDVTLQQFNVKIKDNYVLFLVGSEEHVQAIKEYVDKHFEDINHNIVDVGLPEGFKIYKKVVKEYKVTRSVPQAIYFKNSKKITSANITNNEYEYIQLKQEIEKHK